jgi:hypothetical protein
MSVDSADHPTPPHGLPPVQPPTGQMILRLFLVPALIVGVLVALFLVGPTVYRGFNRLIGRSTDDSRSADQFLRDIDNSNPEVRWRAASDLAQVLLRKKSLAADPNFALALADRLQTALEQSAGPEKEFAAKVGGLTPGDRAREEKKLEPDRNLIIYLSASLGNCTIPLGVPLLKQLAEPRSGLEPEMLLERRGRALFALATLGEALKRYDELSDEEKDAIEQQLDDASKKSNHSLWAKSVLDYLKARRQGKQDTMGVAEVLRKCSGDGNPFIRELSAFASNTWHGTPVEETAIESFLVTLSEDKGEGEKEQAERAEKNPAAGATRPVTTKPGFNVRANATIALARRGSPRVKPALLEEMLDADRLSTIFVLRGKTSADKPDEALVVQTLTNTLKALCKLAEKRPEVISGAARERIVALVNELAKSSNATVRTEAEEAQLRLEKSK